MIEARGTGCGIVQEGDARWFLGETVSTATLTTVRVASWVQVASRCMRRHPEAWSGPSVTGMTNPAVQAAENGHAMMENEDAERERGSGEMQSGVAEMPHMSQGLRRHLHTQYQCSHPLVAAKIPRPGDAPLAGPPRIPHFVPLLEQPKPLSRKQAVWQATDPSPPAPPPPLAPCRPLRQSSALGRSRSVPRRAAACTGSAPL